MTATGWFVLVEQSDLGSGGTEYRVAKTIPAGDDADEAWAVALEVARTHDRFGYASSHIREIYRVPDGALRVLFRLHSSHEYVSADFRVSVAELVEVREPEAPPEEPEAGSQRRKFGLFRR
ncbi:hypothetical protein OHT76_14550 [Streptomyces sp. NBC_00287]|uniref:hypothetical protein n=1 Tax=Streptomyces sp. NBC_00287 TaxID=2975702 RepID=UPI002E280DA3|nr:hypothetical protein [Streptomyces sp. NBC_00287]